MTGNRLVPVARKLRREQTAAEAKLWSVLRNRQLEGLKFRRQHPIGSYVADFCCEEIGLIVELDGGQHADHEQRDRERTIVLEDMKYIVLRFWNIDIIEALDGVIDQILTVAGSARGVSPSPLRKGGPHALAWEDERIGSPHPSACGGRPLPGER